MDFDSVRSRITDVFKTQFAAAQPNVRVKYENLRFSQPKDSPWVEFCVHPGRSRRAGVGSRTYYNLGVFNVIIYVPENTGTKTMHDIAQSVFDILADSNWSLSDGGYLTTYGVLRKPRGTQNGWHIMTVEAAFRHQAER